MSRAAEVSRQLADRAEGVATALLGKPTSTTKHELRWGSRGSVSLCRDGTKRGWWFDHERCEGGDLLHLVARGRGVGLGEAIGIAQRDYLGGEAMPVLARATPQPASTPPDRIAAALRMWKATTALGNTSGERYFVEHRRLDVRRLDLGHVLHWHSGEHCVVALMTDATTNEATRDPPDIPRCCRREDLRARCLAVRAAFGLARTMP